MNYNPHKKDYPDLRRPLPQNYVGGFRTKPVPYLRRPQHPLVIISCEFMRLCACILLVVVALALAMVLSRPV